MERFCLKLKSIMHLEITNYCIPFILCLLAVIVCAILRRELQYKIMLYISSLCLLVIVILSYIVLSPIYRDYRNQSFIELSDVTIVSKTSAGFDLSGTRDISVRTSTGEVIHLKTTDRFEKGEFKANVAYSQRSLYLVSLELADG